MSDLSTEALRIALRPLELLANAPDLDDALIAFLGALLSSERVTRAELMAAIVDITKRQDFWPGPKAILDSVQRARQASFLAGQAEEREARARTYRETLPSPLDPEPAAGEVAELDGLPVPPPREPLPAQEMQRRGLFGPVRLSDGRLDPRWPEHKGREAAWRRKMRYDHGLCSYAEANAPTAAAARALRGSRREAGVRRLVQ